MDHFISVIFAKQLNESKRDIVLDTMINTARVGLTEDSVEYELFESEDSSTVLRLPLAKPIKEAHQQAFVEALANRLFDKGHTDFEIELSVLNENLLRQGSRGADVKALQAQLGMPAAEQDGIYGPNTERAVRTFQQSMGLQVDGIVGPQTRTAIANSQAAGAATRDAPYTPQAVPQTPTQQRAAANPQTAAPQTSPRPQARPAQTTAAPTGPTADQRDAAATAAADRSAGQALDRNTVGTDTRIAPGTTSGGPSRLRQRQMSRANPDANDPRGPDQRNVPSAGATQQPRGTGNATSGATAPGAQGDGLRGNAAVGAGPAQGTTVVGRPNVPVGSLPGSAGAGLAPGTGGQNPDANDPRAGNTDSGFRAPPANPDANDPRAGNTDSGFRAPQGQNLAGLNQRGTAAAGTPTDRLNTKGETPATGRSTQPVQPIGRVSSARPNDPDTGAVVRPGDETNALDAIAQDRASGALPTPSPAAPTAAPANPDANDPRAGNTDSGARGTPANPDANDPRAGNTDSGARGTPNLPNVTAQTTAPTMSAPQGSGTAPNISGTSDPEVNRQTPQAPAFGGGERDVNVDTNAPSQAAPSVDPQVAQGVAGTFYQAMKGGTGIGTNKRQIQRQLAGLQNPDTFNAAAEAYEREHGISLFQHFYDEMSDRQIAKFVKPELDRLGITMPGREKYESVTARPKGAFMFRERNEWDAKYSRTHNRDGSLKAKTNLIESRKYDEVTYHDDDQFYEDYGVMWYNDDDVIDEAEYQGRKVKLGKPMKGDVKKFKVYVRNPKGNVVKVNFGQKGVKIKKSNPARRRSFRARHNCDNPGPRHKARYWSCRKW